MHFLFMAKSSKKAHIWSVNDTACRMWSTGGLNQLNESWTFSQDKQNRKVCAMCNNAYLAKSKKIIALDYKKLSARAI